MKKITALLLVLVLALSLGACGKEEKAVDARMKAVIVDVDPDTRSLTVRDLGNEGIFGEKTTIDCEEAPVRPMGSLNEELSFLDLEPGDVVTLSFSEEAREALKKGEPVIEAIQVEVDGDYPSAEGK